MKGAFLRECTATRAATGLEDEALTQQGPHARSAQSNQRLADVFRALNMKQKFESPGMCMIAYYQERIYPDVQVVRDTLIS